VFPFDLRRLYREGKLTSWPYFQASGYRGFQGWFQKPGDPEEWRQRLENLPDTPRTVRDVRIAGPSAAGSALRTSMRSRANIRFIFPR
jgi:hypothetical protein